MFCLRFRESSKNPGIGYVDSITASRSTYRTVDYSNDPESIQCKENREKKYECKFEFPKEIMSDWLETASGYTISTQATKNPELVTELFRKAHRVYTLAKSEVVLGCVMDKLWRNGDGDGRSIDTPVGASKVQAFPMFRIN